MRASALRLSPAMLARAEAQRRERLAATMLRLATAHRASLRQSGRDLARIGARLDVAALSRIAARHKERYEQTARLFQTLLDSSSPEAILAKGYALVLKVSGRPVRSPAEVAAGDPLTIKVAEGEIGARATLAGLQRPKRTSRLELLKIAKADQGTLF